MYVLVIRESWYRSQVVRKCNTINSSQVLTYLNNTHFNCDVVMLHSKTFILGSSSSIGLAAQC
jgi:hypothetical protein